MNKRTQPSAKTTQTVVVLGANGFIGSHIVDQLAPQPDLRVRAYDRFSREPQFHKSAKVRAVRGTLDNLKLLERTLDSADYLIYSVASTTPFVADANPYADIHGMLEAIQIFELAIQKDVRKIVFISSGGAVYGTSAERGVAHENTSPYPVSPYGICKLSIEHYLEYFKRKFGTDYVVYRLSNPYGPRQKVKHNQGVIPAFLHKIMQGEEVVVFGDGSMSRDYIYIEDAAAMIANTFRQPNKHAVYNIGSGRQTSVNEIIDALKTTLQKDVAIAYKDAPQTFLRKTSISIERFCQEFGEPALTNFAEGLKRTVRHHLDQPDHDL